MIKCKGCKFLEVSSYIFEDGTKSLACDKYKKFLGFTDTNFNFTKVNGVDMCEHNPKVVTISKSKKKIESQKSGVHGIYWLKKSQKWQVKYYDSTTRKCINIGCYADLDEAKEVLEAYKINRTKE